MSEFKSQLLFNVNPKQLIFYAPYDRKQRRLITILNPTAQRLLFKVRCTTPLHYSVSPNSGSVAAYSTVEISVTLSHFDYNNQLHEGHRFCVQCMPAPDDCLATGESVLSLFKQVPNREQLSVRIPVELQPTPIGIENLDLDCLLLHDVQDLLNNLRPLGGNCVDMLQQLPHMPQPSRKSTNRFMWLLLIVFLVLTAASGVYYRQEIEELFGWSN
ncbi:vesicle-associated membrane protein-associated protein A [Drosophila busckii]|uniref:vesicle-associated membrane protein-associated protein A n=1 Tax=Drosophila busckii TaxID=30019 RepID=UPI00083EF20B|nr:vesicle-associated membrane protein-associated protein A [Drosophila busckii]